MFGRNRTTAKHSKSMRPVAAMASLARRPGQRLTSRIAVQLAVIVGLSAVALFAASGSASADETFSETATNTESEKNASDSGLIQEFTGTVDRTTKSVTTTVSEIGRVSKTQNPDFEIKPLAKSNRTKNSAPVSEVSNSPANGAVVDTRKDFSDSTKKAKAAGQIHSDRVDSDHRSKVDRAAAKTEKRLNSIEESNEIPHRKDFLKKSQISESVTAKEQGSDNKASGNEESDNSVSAAKSMPESVSDRNDHDTTTETARDADAASDDGRSNSVLDLATDIVSDAAIGHSRPNSGQPSDSDVAGEGGGVASGARQAGDSDSDTPAGHAASAGNTSAAVGGYRESTATDRQTDLAPSIDDAAPDAAPEPGALTVLAVSSTEAAPSESETSDSQPADIESADIEFADVEPADVESADIESAAVELAEASRADTDSQAADLAETGDAGRASLLNSVSDLLSGQPLHTFAEHSTDRDSSADRDSSPDRNSSPDRETVGDQGAATGISASQVHPSEQSGLLSIVGLGAAKPAAQREVLAVRPTMADGAADRADASGVARSSASTAIDRSPGGDRARQASPRSGAVPDVAPLLDQVISPVLHQTVTPVLGQTVAPVLDQTVAPVLDQTVAPVLDQTVAPVLDQTVAPVLDQTVAPVLDQTAAPILGQTVSPVLDRTVTPVLDQTVAPVLDQTVAPVLDQTVTPVVDQTVAPVLEGAVAPVLGQTVAPVAGPVVETVVSPLGTATAPVTSTVDKVAGTTLATVTSLTAPVVDPVSSAVEPTVESGLKLMGVTVSPHRSADQSVTSDLDQQTTYLRPTSAGASADVTIRTTSSSFAFEPTTASIDQDLTAIRSIGAGDAFRPAPSLELADQTFAPSTGSAGGVLPATGDADDRSDVTSADQPFEPVQVPAQQFTDAALPSLSGGTGSGSGGSITGSGGAPATAGVAVGFLNQPRLAQCGMSHPESTDLPTGPTFGPGCFPD